MMVLGGEAIDCKFGAYPNICRWLGNMKALKSWAEGERGVLQVRGRPQQGQGIRPAVTPARLRRHQRRQAMIKGLHHNAYRCRDSEETRRFYEDFLGLPLSGSLDIRETKSGRRTAVLHTFYRLDDGSYLAFFEAPDMPFEWKAQHDFDLHIALEVEPPVLAEMLAKGKGARDRDPRHFGARVRALDLFSRSERLRDRADREDAGARAHDGPGDQRRARDSRPLAGSRRRALRRAPTDDRPTQLDRQAPPICLKERCVCPDHTSRHSAAPRLSSGASMPSSRRSTSAA